MTKPVKTSFRIGLTMLGLGLLIGVGGMAWAFAQVGSRGMGEPASLARSIVLVFISGPLLLGGILTTVISLIIHFVTRPETSASS